jgi:hypothetical protein
MLDQLRQNIAECYRQVHDFAERAKARRDPALRQDFLDLERRWIFLAARRATSPRSLRVNSRPKLGPHNFLIGSRSPGAVEDLVAPHERTGELAPRRPRPR